MKSRRSSVTRRLTAMVVFTMPIVGLGQPLSLQAARGTGSSAREADSHLLKVSSHLVRARELARQGWAPDRIKGRLPAVRFDGDLLEVEIRLREVTPLIVEELEARGLQVVSSSERWARVTGRCAPESLDEIAALDEVRTVHPRLGAVARAGSVTSQGDVSINADDARAAWGLGGEGVKVGVLSDSFAVTPTVLGAGSITGPNGCDQLLTGANPQNTGDLPAQVRILDNCESGVGCDDGHTDEGAALAEVIHDLAPGAEILFHTAFRDEADFADGITELVNCGADALIDDVFYFAEPMFQDGIVAQAAQQAVDGGVHYFSAAGNQGGFGADEVFLDFAVADDQDFPVSGDDLHDFGGGDRFGSITIPNGCGIRLILQWNEPFDGVLGPGSAKDLDLYLCSSATVGGCDDSNALASAADSQGCDAISPSGDPFEFLDWFNGTGTAKTGYVAVDHFCGAQSDTRFRIASFALDCSVQAGYSFEAGIFDKAQIYGHPAAAGANAVAAVFYAEIDSGGALVPPAGQIDVRASSSLGGDLPFYFDGSGAPLAGAPVARAKPEIAAPEGVNNTFFGIDNAFDADTFPNFSGTSPAAAHAAGVAALLLEVNPVLTPQEGSDALATSAIDIESAGPDPLSGAGLIDAQAAVLAIPTVPLLEVGPAALAFATRTPGTSSAPQEVTLENVNLGLNPASEQVQVSAITVSDTTNFALDLAGGAFPCGGSTPTIGWGSTCTVMIVSQPQSVGVFNADLTVDSDSAVGPSQVVGLSGAGCGTLTLDLTGGPTGNPEVKEACVEIAAGPYAIGGGDDVTFRSGQRIVLRDGFTVAGGIFTAVIDPSLVALP